MKTPLTRPREVTDGLVTSFRIDYEYHNTEGVKSICLQPSSLGPITQYAAGTDASQKTPNAFIESQGLADLRTAYEAQRLTELTAHLNIDPEVIKAEVTALVASKAVMDG